MLQTLHQCDAAPQNCSVCGRDSVTLLQGRNDTAVSFSSRARACPEPPSPRRTRDLAKTLPRAGVCLCIFLMQQLGWSWTVMLATLGEFFFTVTVSRRLFFYCYNRFPFCASPANIPRTPDENNFVHCIQKNSRTPSICEACRKMQWWLAHWCRYFPHDCLIYIDLLLSTLAHVQIMKWLECHKTDGVIIVSMAYPWYIGWYGSFC